MKLDVSLPGCSVRIWPGSLRQNKRKDCTDFPTDPKEQLTEAIKAVFPLLDNPSANVNRRDNDIPIPGISQLMFQMMAFERWEMTWGNRVAFTR